MNENIIKQVLQWGKDKGLHNTADLGPQFIKLTEELGELAAGIARGNHAKIVDSVGDMLVVLIQLGAVHMNTLPSIREECSPEYLPTHDYLSYCLLNAWMQIRDRKGKTVAGVFVKEEA